ncbi:MAG: Pls/PosA family non-ribosomal peptide synthetase [Verrucomicrobiota bacterium]|jgi:non-ribosomal peptide synthetase-like protein
MIEPDDNTAAKRKLQPGLLHELFEHQADLRPEAVALVCAGGQMTYGELERRANQLARALRQQGVGRGDRVGLWLPRSMEAHVALLGILKAGAAYVPLDAEFPSERVGFVLADCQAHAVVTTGALAARLGGFSGGVMAVDERAAEIAGQSGARLCGREIGLEPEDLCYVIYTSGTTGKPKGVEIEHRSVCHLARAEGEIFQVRPDDRVFQGFSIAFDGSVEEIWLAYFAGATLVVGTLEMVRAGAELPRMLDAAGVTVLSCVPTLLSMMEEEATRVRLLILGGEVCPPDLVKRWWKPARRVFNTYGPTEATVIATFAECRPDKPVTLGRPVPGYFARILDERLEPVAGGAAGELCLGGAGLALGYAGRPELTREKFIDWSWNGEFSRRLYRTGDLARWTPGGEIEFLGRIDTQVKIRGYRVELSEIESVLLQCPGVKAAAAALREDVPGAPQLTGYLTPRGAEAPDLEKIRAVLRARLPSYMVPALLETLAQLPLLPSGKVDRNRLPAPRARPAEAGRVIAPPRTALERQIAAVWEKLFAPAPVSAREDFFLELGGHSLLAARMVSELRRQAGLEQISMLDVYQHPTIEKLAAEFEKRRRPPEPARAAAAYRAVPFWRHFFCGTAQLFSLVLILSFFALQWLTPYLTYTMMVDADYETAPSLLAAFGSLILLYPVMLLAPIAIKWIFIGRYKPGVWPLWGWFYFRWWFATTIEAAVPVSYLAGTPVFNMYLRLMGAKIGKNAHLDSDSFCIYDLVSVGDGASVNVDSNLPGYTVENGMLKIGRITIGRRCFVGARAALREDTVMEDDSALEDLSLLPRGSTIPRGQTWLGSPARPTTATAPAPDVGAGAGRRCVFGVLHGVGALIFPALVAGALFPGIMAMNELNYLDEYYWYLSVAPLVGLSFLVLLCLEITCVKWLLLGREKPGTHRLHTWRYLRRWFFNQTMNLSLDILGPLYASIYLAPWYRMLGVKLGDGVEVSTASYISPDLLSIDDGGFIADSVSMGAPRVRNGVVRTGINHVGKRSFIGNSAMLPPGTVIGDHVLIGCLSAPPANPADALREESAWLGSPAFYLPQREKSAGFSEETTFRPNWKLQAQRAAIEFVRVLTPSTCFIILISLLFSGLLLLDDYYSYFETLLFFPLLYLGCGLAAAGVAIVGKWILVWRYRPGEKPLWSTAVWRNELINALHEHVAEPFLVGALTGTPFVCWYFRLLGAKIGRRVYMETTDLSEFDLVDIGDEAMLNADCTIQTHLFEDRVMKMAVVKIGPRCHVGAGSLALYDTVMEEGAALGYLSLLMKGETLPAWSRWQGIPAQRAE